MEHWHVDASTGLMICAISEGYMVAVPGRPVIIYFHHEVEHVVLTGVGNNVKRIN